MSYKQAIVVRSDLGMGKGKIAAQCAHASLMAYELAPVAARNSWKDSGTPKIVLKVDSENELLRLFTHAKNSNLPVSLVRDAGRTQIEAGSATAVAIGPAKEADVDAVTGKLKLL